MEKGAREQGFRPTQRRPKAVTGTCGPAGSEANETLTLGPPWGCNLLVAGTAIDWGRLITGRVGLAAEGGGKRRMPAPRKRSNLRGRFPARCSGDDMVVDTDSLTDRGRIAKGGQNRI